MKIKLPAILLLCCIFVLPLNLYSHRSGCHRWHSCPSDSGSYTCGDTGYCSACPDNKFCKNRSPRASKSEEVVKESKNKDNQKCDMQKDIQNYYNVIGGKIDLKSLSPKETECMMIIFQVLSKSNAPKASDECKDAWDQANSAADEVISNADELISCNKRVVSNAEGLISCIKRSNNRDDCYSYKSLNDCSSYVSLNDCSSYEGDVKSSYDDYESAVSDVNSYCD